ncbi:MAG: hypothetical protein V2B14_03045 [bacterium]
MNTAQKFNNKFCFMGISPASSILSDSGIAVIDRNLNLLRVDKIFDLDDLKIYIKNLAPIESVIACVDLPRNMDMVTGKWRQEARNAQTFKLNEINNSKFVWAERFSDRGAELCYFLSSLGIDVYRYYCYFTKNALKLSPPYKSRSPAACKYLQTIIQNNLKISGIPSNLIALSGLDAIIGAYTALKMTTSEENVGYRYIGKYKDRLIVTSL